MKNDPKVRALSAALPQSSDLSDSVDHGSTRDANTMLTRPIGTLTANSHCHGPIARMPEATVGPIAPATDTTSAFRPTPWPSDLCG